MKRQANNVVSKREVPGESVEARSELLRAAETCLRRDGYAALTTRRVALAANAPLSQIHYHFGSKQGLVLALFEALNKRLLHRQDEMFHRNLPLWRQWEIACDFLDEDLDSGYVRILNELSAASWSDHQISCAIKEALFGWQKLLLEVARSASKRFGGFGPLDPEDVAALIGSAFIGAEINILTGREGPELPIRRALRRFGNLIQQHEKRKVETEDVKNARKTTRPRRVR